MDRGWGREETVGGRLKQIATGVRPCRTGTRGEISWFTAVAWLWPLRICYVSNERAEVPILVTDVRARSPQRFAGAAMSNGKYWKSRSTKWEWISIFLPYITFPTFPTMALLFAISLSILNLLSCGVLHVELLHVYSTVIVSRSIQCSFLDSCTSSSRLCLLSSPLRVNPKFKYQWICFPI